MSRLADKLEPGLREADVPDFIYIEGNDYSKYESSSSLQGQGAAPKSKLAEEVFPCDCRWPGDWNFDETSRARRGTVACGEHAGCINRTLFVECRPQDCPCGDKCQNQRFQKSLYKDVEIMKAPGKGHGLRAREDLQPGDFIIEYVGEVVSHAQMEKRVEINFKLGQQHYYFMTLQNDQILDATRKGNLARFMNHSCNPNCATQKWIVNGMIRIGLFAVKPVPAGSELTFDYKFVRFSSEAQKCVCGEPNCKGSIGTERKDQDAFFPASENEDDFGQEGAAERVSGVEDPEDMASLAKVLLRKKQEDDIKPLILTLANTTSQACLKKFVALHGLQILQITLGQHWSSPEMLQLIIDVLQILPVPSKNVIEDSKIEAQLGKLRDREDIASSLRQSISELQAKWKDLEHAFKIPKATEASAAPSQPSPREDRSLTPSSIESAGYKIDLGLEDPKYRVSKWSNIPATHREDGPIRSPRETEAVHRRPRSALSGPSPATHQDRDYFGPKAFDHVPKKQKTAPSPETQHVAAPRTILPEGWKEAHAADGKPYYYNELTRETRWDPPPTSIKVEPIAIQVEGLKSDDGIAEIISRAKAAALAKTSAPLEALEKPKSLPTTILPSGPSLSQLDPSASSRSIHQIREQISAVVVKHLSKYKDQFKDNESFKEMARKLTHGLSEKEYRALIAGAGPFELTKQKKFKIVTYVSQYLRSHGFRNVSVSSSASD